MRAGEKLQVGDTVAMAKDGKYYRVRTKQEEIREKQDKILNLVKVWAVIPHPYESRDAEGLLYMLSQEEGVMIKASEQVLPDRVYFNEDNKDMELELSGHTQMDMLRAGYVAFEPLI